MKKKEIQDFSDPTPNTDSLGQGILNLESDNFESKNSPVMCLGMEFPDDAARRSYFLDKLSEFLADPEFRKIEGFPIGKDEDILALSDPPYYTACPNPWVSDFIAHWRTEQEDVSTQPYHREPFAADVSEGKNDPIYNAHSYHTKVPHKAIMRYILHYTEPGDVVFDGFCGTGMTGVAAQLCGDRKTVESLGYKVDDQGLIYQQETDEDGKIVWVPFSRLGVRPAVLNDLSPAATFIAYNYNVPVDVGAFEREAKRILQEVEEECGWMYETLHVEPASSRLIAKTGFKKPVLGQRVEPASSRLITGFTIRKDNLPHWQSPGGFYFVTFKTKDRRALTDEAKTIVKDALLFWHGQRLKLISAVVMPDHVHAVICPLEKSEGVYWDLSDLLHSTKSYSANEINKKENKVGVTVWQTESYDRIVRDEKELGLVLQYIAWNPVKAGLAEVPEEYEWFVIDDVVRKAGWKPAPLGKINYTVWSDVFVCPECTQDVIFWEAAVDKEAGKVRSEFPCPHCGANLTKRNMDRAWVTKIDPYITQHSVIRQAKQVPVLVNYSVGKKRYEKTPDAFDLALIEKIEQLDIPYWFPTDRMPEGYNTEQPKVSHGLTHVHHFYTKRNLWVLGAPIAKVATHSHRRTKAFLRFLFEQWVIGFSLLNRYSPHHYSQNNRNLSGTLYVGSQISEVSPEYAFPEKIKRLVKAFGNYQPYTTNLITTLDTSVSGAIDQSIDYIFTDPPFGGNLMYSELNFLWEAWLKVFTNNKSEAITNKVQGKGLPEYQRLMTECFKEYYRVLKPGRWMTVEFHNSKNSVWNAIQEALQVAGFVVADVRTLDKKQGSFKQVTSASAVKQDLVISAYKPNYSLEERFKLTAGTEEGVWDFIRTHLRQLPVFVLKVEPASSRLKRSSSLSRQDAGSTDAGSTLEIIAERQNYLLYDRMVAFHVQRGVTVPMSAAEFYAGLEQRFPPRDGMYFLPDQAAEYDKKRMTVKEVLQLSLFVSDEASAIQWLKQQLTKRPQTFQELHPQFLKEIGGWQKHEKALELSELLEQNFLRYDGKELIPAQIVSWLKQSSKWRELISAEVRSARFVVEDSGALRTTHHALLREAKDRWYVPDPNKAGDLEKLRERALLREFQEYVELASSQPQKRLKVFRLEAVRAGFKKAWQERDYATIIAVARKIPEKILQEDPKLLMWYDQAITRMEGK